MLFRFLPNVMRYLGQFPSEQQIVDVIIPEIEEDAPSNYIRYSSFEPYMVNGIILNIYELIFSTNERRIRA